METVKISRALLRRLPMYLTYLKALPGEDHNISATAIAEALGLGDVQVRKDLAKISDTGRRRIGRSRDQLIRDIEQYMDFTSAVSAVIIGAGVLGQALLDYTSFENAGLRVLACFDYDPQKKQTEGGKPIYSMGRLETFCKHYEVRIGIIAIPEVNAQQVCDRLIACGVRGSWNFTSAQLQVPGDVVVRNENLTVSVSSLRLQLKNMENRLRETS